MKNWLHKIINFRVNRKGSPLLEETILIGVSLIVIIVIIGYVMQTLTSVKEYFATFFDYLNNHP